MAHDFKKYPELTNNQMQFYYLDSPHKQIAEDFSGRVERVIDGDTVSMSWNERSFNFPVRMLGINAPEMSEGGKESKDWLRGQIEGLEVEVIIDKKERVGKYGRILGKIIANGIDMAQMSLTFGFSRPFGQELTPIPNLNKELAGAIK